MTDKKSQILVLCTGNSARSQMAEGLLRKLAGENYDVYSAGTKPSIVRPEAIAVLAEIGIDISNNRSKSVDEFTGQHIDYVLTVCDSARQNCPYFPASSKIIHHSFPDPAEVEGDLDARTAAFRITRNQISAYLPLFLDQIKE